MDLEGSFCITPFNLALFHTAPRKPCVYCLNSILVKYDQAIFNLLSVTLYFKWKMWNFHLNYLFQMLVPATAEDLKVGGKIVVKNDENGSPQVN